jgi:hypothetical protein
VKAGTRLDLVADVLVLDHDAALGRVAGAAAAVNQEARAAAHVAVLRVQLVAVRHALEGLHVAQLVVALREGANAHLAL